LTARLGHSMLGEHYSEDTTEGGRVRVSIHLEDVENNTVAMRADFHNGKNPNSPAHAMGVQLIKFLEDRLNSGHELVEDTIDLTPAPETSRIIHAH